MQADEIKKNRIDKFDFMKAIANTKPTVSPNDLVAYEKWTKEFGMEG